MALTVHLEWRASRAATLRRLGIETVDDIVAFDYRAFWAEKLQLRTVDIEKLGRWKLRSRRRTAWVKEWSHNSHTRSYNVDRRVGSMVARSVAREGDAGPLLGYGAAQDIKDACGPDAVRRAFFKLDNSWLLPEPDGEPHPP